MLEEPEGDAHRDVQGLNLLDRIMAAAVRAGQP
jgi:hypothetical protein